MQNEDPVDLTVTLPVGGRLDGDEVRRYLEDELRTRAEVTEAGQGSLMVRAYRREEVESVADELLLKLGKMERADGCCVQWTGDDGAAVKRCVE